MFFPVAQQKPINDSKELTSTISLACHIQWEHLFEYLALYITASLGWLYLFLYPLNPWICHSDKRDLVLWLHRKDFEGFLLSETYYKKLFCNKKKKSHQECLSHDFSNVKVPCCNPENTDQNKLKIWCWTVISHWLGGTVKLWLIPCGWPRNLWHFTRDVFVISDILPKFSLTPSFRMSADPHNSVDRQPSY